MVDPGDMMAYLIIESCVKLREFSTFDGTPEEYEIYLYSLTDRELLEYYDTLQKASYERARTGFQLY